MFPLLESSFKIQNNDDNIYTLDGPATSDMSVCVKWNILYFILVIHASSTVEGQLLRSYEACCFKKLNKETKRLLTTKILHFDNVWFLLHNSGNQSLITATSRKENDNARGVENQYFGPAFDEEHSSCVEEHEITLMELNKGSGFRFGDNYLFPLENETTSLECKQSTFEYHSIQDEDFFEPLQFLITWENYETNRDSMLFDDYNASIEENTKGLILDSDVLLPHSYEIATLTFGKTCKEESISAGTQDACINHDNLYDASHHKTDFRHFGAAVIEQSQKLNEGWLEKANKAKIVAQQAKLHLQHVRDVHHSFDDERHELINSEFPFEVFDHSLGDDSDLLDDFLGGPATLSLSPISLDMAAISLLIGDFIFFDSTWDSGCPSCNYVVLLDFSWNTSALRLLGSVWKYVYWMNMEYEMGLNGLHWYDDTYDIIQFAGLSYNNDTRWLFVLVYWVVGVHFHTFLLVYSHGWLFHGVWLRYFPSISFSRFDILVWDSRIGFNDALAFNDLGDLLQVWKLCGNYVRMEQWKHIVFYLRLVWNPGGTVMHYLWASNSAKGGL